MPINVYTGLMRSGKSYEVVSEVILNAIETGRRVVTNVDGISNDLVREFVATKRRIEIDKLGTIVHVSNGDVANEDFFPYYDDDKSSCSDTIVQPGDLVCIDEAWRFWGTDCKLLKQHKSFFLEHGHFTHPISGVSCDLVLMIQDMGTLNRFVKNVVAFNFRTHKKISLGLNKTYSVNCYEGHKQTKQTFINGAVRNYKKEIFPLYSSFKGGADGKTVNVDKRQNKLGGLKIWLVILGFGIIGVLCSYFIWRFFHPAPTKVALSQPSAAIQTVAPASIPSIKKNSVPVSEAWRVGGTLFANGRTLVLVANGAGIVRLESQSSFQNYGWLQVGQIDGEQVTTWSGALPVGKSGLIQPSAPSAALGSAPISTAELKK